jgi:hypothetical protein
MPGLPRALAMARDENESGVGSSYFFKTRPDVFVPAIVQQIAALNHEIGYHYEDLVRNNGNYSKAISDFERNLDSLRSLFPVTKICADGNPLSKYNNLWLWDKYDFQANAALNIHPQRWNNNPFAWTKELLLQNVKNVVKLGLRKGK